MPHGNTVINGNGIEFSSKKAMSLDRFFYLLPDIMQMHMSGNELCKRIYNGNYRFAEMVFLHSVSSPQASCAGHQSSLSSCGTSELYFHLTKIFMYKKAFLFFGEKGF